ncbi:MAG: hypothetical protein KDM81_15155 [Verrucomicrobiae bacterium]|nr:hypothetical protein [Verrucomicrobiae bacterium]MCP5521545.1 hypothetical protein [Verrucomicrobiales bacterium]
MPDSKPASAAPPSPPRQNRGWLGNRTWASCWAVVAAFGAYACMYGLRKPFTAATYEAEGMAAGLGTGFKAWLVTAQVLGYTLSKIVGIKVIAEMPPARRALSLLALVGIAEGALLLFAVTPIPWNSAWLFLNGLALGMVFGLVLGFLEGRRLTEALIAGLCASFILADGVAKSVGAYLLKTGVTELWMPAVAGGLFLLPLGGFVWMLRAIPPPSAEDVEARSERMPMTRRERRALFRRFAPGLVAIALTYLLVTILRSIRADFAPELWRTLGLTGQPGIFARSEFWVALGVTASNGLLVLIRDNRRAFFLSLGISAGGLGMVAVALLGLDRGVCGPFAFMVLLGLGMYLPYVAVHTTIFERLLAMTRQQGNLGFLMYVADATGYLGYVALMLGRQLWPGIWPESGNLMAFFKLTAWLVAGASLIALAFAAIWFFRHPATRPDPGPASQGPVSLAPDSAV